MQVRFEYDNGGLQILATKLHKEWPERYIGVEAAKEWLEEWLKRTFLPMPLNKLRQVELEMPFRGVLAIPVFHDVSDGTGLLQVRFAEFMRGSKANDMVRFGETEPGDNPAGFRPPVVLMKHSKD